MRLVRLPRATNPALNSGPLHTRAKGRDHEIVRAQKKVSKLKAVPTHLPHHVVWSRMFKCSVKSCVTWPSTKCYFNELLLMWVLTHNKID